MKKVIFPIARLLNFLADFFSTDKYEASTVKTSDIIFLRDC